MGWEPLGVLEDVGLEDGCGCKGRIEEGSGGDRRKRI